MSHILITGGAGFIGSHLVEHILAETDWTISIIDGLTYAGDVARFTDSRYFDKSRIRIFWHDLNAPIPGRLRDRIGAPDYIINMASASHVDTSISDPVPFVRNNVNLVLHMLEFAREVRPRIFIQISTDEVYGAAGPGELHREWSEIKPSNPYAASKAAQEAIAVSYWRTYGVPVVITNTMNNFGERQDREKFIPKCLHAIMTGAPMTIHGTPGNIGTRCYLHARNHADALLFLLRQSPANFPAAEIPDRYNITGGEPIDNLAMAKKIAAIAGRDLHYDLLDFHSTRPGHDPHYALDGAKLAGMGWSAPLDIDRSLERTVHWTLANEYN